MKQGIVTFVHPVGNYGFVRSDDGGANVFIAPHLLKLAGAVTGSRVEFEDEDSPRGRRATQLELA